MPEAGTRVWLRRGSLDSEGEVAWAKGAHCGVRFVSPIAVEEWVARAGPVGQQRIDAAIAELRDLCFKGHIDVGDFVAELRDLCERMNAHPHMTVGIAEQILKIEAAAHAIRSAATRY